MKTYHKQTDIDVLKESLQRLFDGKLKNIQEANKRTSLSIQNVNDTIQDALKRTFQSIQNVNNQVQEANKKITENKNYINLLQFFPEGKNYPFCCFKNISRVLDLHRICRLSFFESQSNFS